MSRLIDLPSLLAPLIAAPLLYPLIGYPWARWAGQTHLAALLGLAICGLTSEFGYIAGLPVSALMAAVFGVHAIWLGLAFARRSWRPAEVGMAVRDFLPFYLMALVPLLVAPFALPGRWAADWAIALESGHALFLGSPELPGSVLTRPPLFGAATAPLWWLGPVLPAFQGLCAVGAACALQVFRAGLPQGRSLALVWLLAGSVFFLQNTAASWAKLTTAAFLVAAWLTLDTPSVARQVLAACLTGLAMASHQAAVLFAPLLLLRLSPEIPWHGNLGRKFREWLRFIGVASIFVLPWEAYTLLRYGLEAKAGANPALSERPNLPGWVNSALVAFTTFVAWGPVESIVAMAREPGPRDLSFFVRLGFWIATGVLNVLCSTIVCMILPCWLAIGTRGLKTRLGRLWRETRWDFCLAWFVAFFGHVVLNPYYSPDGSSHTGWVPACIALMLWLAHQVIDIGDKAVRRALILTLWTAALPWILFQTALGGMLLYSPAFAQRFRDTDYLYLQAQQLTSLGLAAFPLGAVFAMVMLGLALRASRQTHWLHGKSLRDRE